MLGITGLIIMDRTQLASAYSTFPSDRPEPGPVLPPQVPVTIPGVTSHSHTPSRSNARRPFLNVFRKYVWIALGVTVE